MIKNLKQDTLRYVLNNNLLNDRGLVLEFGCWKGQTIDMISDFTSKNVYSFDTFEGMDCQWGDIDMRKFKLPSIPNKVHKLDKFTQRKKTNEISAFNKNVKFIKGFFKETLPDFLIRNKEAITFIHVDCDLYESTKTIFEHCGSRISNDCIIVFDDIFNVMNYEDHEYKAFNEWVEKYDIVYEWIGSSSRVLNDEDIKFVDSLSIKKECLNYDNIPRFNDTREEVLFGDKMILFNLKCQAAVKIISNPKFREVA